MNKIYIERTHNGIKDIIVKNYNLFPKDVIIQKWCKEWNDFTSDFTHMPIRLNMYLYNLKPYVGIKV